MSDRASQGASPRRHARGTAVEPRWVRQSDARREPGAGRSLGPHREGQSFPRRTPSPRSGEATETCNEAIETRCEKIEPFDEAIETCDEATETCDEATETCDEATETCDEATETCDDAAETCDDAIQRLARCWS